MATRKDLLKAHQFTQQRLVQALVARNPDDQDPQLRRVATGTFISVMVGVLLLAVFGVIGLIFGGGSKNWQQDRAIIIDSTSGGVFVYLDTTLHPVANITSARLATDNGSVITVKGSSLRDAPQGQRIGIPAAPQQLPAPADLTAFPLRTCSTEVDPNQPADQQRRTTLEVGGLTTADPLPTGDGASAAVRDGSGRFYLITQGRAHLVPSSGSDVPAVLVSLGFTQAGTVPDAWIGALPRGGDVVAPEIDELGKAVQKQIGKLTTIGQLARVEGQVDTYYVLLRDGLSEISPLQFELFRAQGSSAVEISAADVSLSSDPSLVDPDLPARLPKPDADHDPTTESLCLVWTGADQPPRLTIGAQTPQPTGASQQAGTADLVHTPALRGALLRPADAAADAAILITDDRQYPIADPDSRAALGYAEAPSAAVPAGLIKLVPAGLPAGGSLSRSAALQPY